MDEETKDILRDIVSEISWANIFRAYQYILMRESDATSEARNVAKAYLQSIQMEGPGDSQE